MIIALACILAIAVIGFVLFVRPQDLPEVESTSPFAHLDERKASIYENLRDLQFEYRVGKLSDADYQQSKQDLQKELAAVMEEVDKVKAQLNGAPSESAPTKPVASRNRESAPQTKAPASQVSARTCSACGAKFEKDLKFCGECGKPMKVALQ